MVTDGTLPAAELLKRSGASGTVDYEYQDALTGFAGKFDRENIRKLATLEEVLFIEEDAVYTTAEVQQAGATWGLDRVDQRFLALDGSYWYYNNFTNPTGSWAVHAYVLDTGIAPHANYAGRLLNSPGDFFGLLGDCNGHGTHVAGTLGSTTWGVAKQVALHPVRVFNAGCTTSLAAIIAGVNWVTANAKKPAVANMSLQGPFSLAMNTAINNSVNSGVNYAVAAGNFSVDACNISPASAALALTAGATDINDAKAGFSNFGPCVDLFAPGVNIISTFPGGGTAISQGTSMASPHVAGAEALYFMEYPWASSAQAQQAILATVTTNVLTALGAGSPNRLLNTRLGSQMASFSSPISPFQVQIQPRGTFYFGRFAGPHEARLTGPAGTDFDLELYRWQTGGPGFVQVGVSATLGTSTERIIFHGTGDALYFWAVSSASGSGTYTLRTSQP